MMGTLPGLGISSWLRLMLPLLVNKGAGCQGASAWRRRAKDGVILAVALSLEEHTGIQIRLGRRSSLQVTDLISCRRTIFLLLKHP